jgi:hypothetical protein
MCRAEVYHFILISPIILISICIDFSTAMVLEHPGRKGDWRKKFNEIYKEFANKDPGYRSIQKQPGRYPVVPLLITLLDG